MRENYVPPKVWKWKEEDRISSTNRPIAGAIQDKELPIGKHGLQLYSMATPNGVKVTIMLEELLGAGYTEAEYDAWPIHIGKGEQFGSGFVSLNPNSKIPVLQDRRKQPYQRVFESGSILLYLAESFQAFLPKNPEKRCEALNWLFWQVGSGPYVGGGFGHFYAYAPEKMEYPINRFAMETKRQLDVLDQYLEKNEYMAGNEYSIADMAICPWYGALVKGALYDSAEFLSVNEYTHVMRWANQIMERPAVKQGRIVNRLWGDPSEQLHERHEAIDFETKTQDKIS